jgi:hypothetical protein
MSAAARKPIADAQRRRWAASKHAVLASAPAVAPTAKRKLSEAGRASIVDHSWVPHVQSLGTSLSLPVSNLDMARLRNLLFLGLLISTLGHPQGSDSSSEPEEAIQKTAPDRKLDKGDVQCGNYLWIATRTGTKFLYYFFGSTEWGKSKVGFYEQSQYHVVVNADKDPPAVQRLKDAKGTVTAIRIQMTGQELAASRACLSEP